jgi:putative chitinase
MLIAQAVGTGAPNLAADVKVVQILLNMNLARMPGQPPVDEDGKFGDHTLAAIRSFQSKAMAIAQPGSVITPDSPIIAELGKGLPKRLSEATFQLVMLFATPERIDRFLGPVVDRMTAAGIDTSLRQSHFLAQIGHESGDLRYTQELASGEAYEGRADLGNTQPGDGARFKGRGLIQLTGRANYAAYGHSIGIDLTVDNNWEKVATDPKLAVDVACWFWTKHGLNAPADADDLDRVTRMINGGLNGIADRAAHLDRAKFVLD